MNNWLKIFFLLPFIYFLLPKSSAQEYVLNYQHLQTKDGLANAFVNCALQDNDGFMWFGTNDGLCRYDGRNFLTFRNSEEDSILLGSNAIQDIKQFDERYFLIGTTAGLSKLDLYTQKISRIDFFNQKEITSIFIDSQKTTWVVANKKLFFKEDKQTNWENYTTYALRENPNFDKKQITGIYEKSINNQNYLVISEEINNVPISVIKISYKKYSDKKWKQIVSSPFFTTYFGEKNIWLSYTKRIQKYAHLHQIYDTTIFKIRVIEDVFNNSNKLGFPFCNTLKLNNYLYSYNSEGILIIDTQKQQIDKFIDWSKTTLDTDKYSIVGIYKDKTDNLWIYTYGAGIAVVPMYTLFSLKEYKFKETDEANTISGASVRTIYQNDSTKSIWIAAHNEKMKIDVFHQKEQKKSSPFYAVPYLFREQIDKKNNLWLGTYNGLYKIDKQNTYLKMDSLLGSQTNSLLPLNDSTIWFSEDYLLKKYNPTKIKTKKQEIIYPQYGKVNCLFLDRKKRIWVGSLTNGIALLDTTNTTAQKQPTFYNPNINSKNKNCQVMAIYQDSKNLFWLATTNGIYSFDEKIKNFKNYNQKNGLPNNTVYAILEDENYNLWLSTNYGISKFTIQKETFENYDESDGLQNNEFNQKAYFKNAAGELFFGGIDGMNVFFPKDIKRNNFVPSLYLTKITKQDSIIKFDKPLHQVKKIELPIEEAQILSFSFVALNYYRPEKNKYAYKIDELQNDWINLGNEGKLTLTGLAHGNYTLRIKAANNHGVWNEEGITLKLVLVPPFYLQNWFFVVVALFFIGVGYLFFRFRIYQIKQREQFLEQLVKERTHDLAKSNRTKERLFAIVAHDLRSPIASFQSISRQINFFLRKNKPEKLQEISEQIDSSAQHINNLLNNLLSWVLTQQDEQIQIEKSSLNLNKSVDEILKSYQTIALAYSIEVKNTIPKDTIIWVDTDTFQTIIRNLINNALKYTPENGSISLSISSTQSIQHEKTKNETVVLKIEDTGIGMSEKIKEKLSSKLMQLDLNYTQRGLRGEKSTGLGLLLCYEFAALNTIEIKLESKKNEGTTFYLFIPTTAN